MTGTCSLTVDEDSIVRIQLHLEETSRECNLEASTPDPVADEDEVGGQLPETGA